MSNKLPTLLLLAIAAIIWLPVLGHPAPGEPQDASAIRQVLENQQAAWNRGDIPTFVSGYWNSPDLTFSGSDGIVRGFDGVLARYQKSYPDQQAMGQLTFSGLEVRLLGSDNALVLGHWHLKRVGGDAGGVFSLVFQHFPDGWRIIHDHTSSQKMPQ
jgi:ketosteroid isomerase-like protein